MKIVGRYDIERELGRGGMSVVHLAYDTRLNRKVAIKVMHPHLASREEARKRFLQEAKAIARLKHPNILEVYDYEATDAQTSYIVSEYIEGMTIRQFFEDKTVVHAEVMALVAYPIFDALAHAHDHQIIHRDIKPENLMFRKNGSPVLMDFGIAHLIDAETLTATGAVIGSPAHMAPEVVNGESLSFKSDLFSMGTVLYWIVCGVLPFTANHPAALFRKILESNYEPVQYLKPKTPKYLSRLIEACLKRDPADRPESAAKIAMDLKTLLYELGMTDINAELEWLYSDFDGYQAQLPSRLIPFYMTAAESYIEKKSMAQGIDRLNRILTLNPEHEEANRLLTELTSREGYWKNGLLFILLGLMAGLVFFFLFPAKIDEKKQSQQKPILQKISSNTQSTNAQSTNAQSTNAQSTNAQSTNAQSTNAQSTNANSKPQTPNTTIDVVPVKSVKTRRLMIKSNLKDTELLIDNVSYGKAFDLIKSYPNGISLEDLLQYEIRLKHPKCPEKSLLLNLTENRDSIISLFYDCIAQKSKITLLNPKNTKPINIAEGNEKKEKNTAEPQANKISPKIEQVQAMFKIDTRFKNAAVYLDRKAYGKIFEIEINGGIPLLSHQEYDLLIKNEGCKDFKDKLYFKESNGLIRRSYECEYKPAKLKIISRTDFDIYVDDKPMGKSNQEILIDMNSNSTMSKIKLFNAADNTVSLQLELKLEADKLTQRNIN